MDRRCFENATRLHSRVSTHAAYAAQIPGPYTDKFLLKTDNERTHHSFIFTSVTHSSMYGNDFEEFEFIP